MNSYTITEVIMDCVECLKDSDDQSNTTIRCTINQLLDSADKNGFKVNFDYDQESAIKRVKKILRL